MNLTIPVKREKHNAVVAELEAANAIVESFRTALGLPEDATQETFTSEINNLVEVAQSIKDFDPEQLETLQTQLNTATQSLDAETKLRQTAEENLATAQKELADANTQLQAANTTITQITELTNGFAAPQVEQAESLSDKVKAITEIATQTPGAFRAESNQDPLLTKKEGVDWDAINKLPHNQGID